MQSERLYEGVVIYCTTKHHIKGNEMKTITEKQRDIFAIEFANWLSELTPSEKVSVWSKTGESKGLFTMDNEQLLAKYKRVL